MRALEDQLRSLTPQAVTAASTEATRQPEPAAEVSSAKAADAASEHSRTG